MCPGSKDHRSRLATIVVADIVGYSALMSADEEGTYAALRSVRQDVIEPGVEEAGGRIVKHLGDGFLAEFPTALAAVEFAASMQNELHSRNARTPQERRILFRIGINLGDIIVSEEGDVFGDGVNVAARLESLAPPGGICVSAAIYDLVHKKFPARFEDLGEQTVKNLSTPVRAYCMRGPGEDRSRAREETRPARKSLFGELKRRNVFRVAIAYLAAAWLLTEVASTLFPLFGVPEWGVRFIVILFAIGFLPALVFSWAYEITPEGLKRETEVVRDVSITHVTARRLDWMTIALIVLAGAFIVADRTWFRVDGIRETSSADAEIRAIQPETRSIEKSIAVLPFANRSANPEDAYFVDGIHDDLLTHISKIGSIKTISRTSVMHYRESSKTIPEIALELGVTTILEGGIQRSGDQIRINVQLIDAQTDEHLWAEIYDRKLTAANVFGIQSEIARAVTKELEAILTPAEQERLLAIPTTSLEAYDAYLMGRQEYAELIPESLARAIGHFRQAVALDPEFALAWVGLADAYLDIAGQKEFPFEEAYARAENALNTALEIDGELGEAYTSFGRLRREQNDLEGARRYYERAFEFSPNYAPLSRQYGILLHDFGKFEESLRWKATAIALDPRSPELRRSYAASLREANRVDEAMEQLHAALEIDPDFAGALDAMATIDWQRLNRLDEAAKAFTEVINLHPSNSWGYVWLAELYLDLGERPRANALVVRAIELAPDEEVTQWGRLLLNLGDFDPNGTRTAANAVLEKRFGADWHAALAAAQLAHTALRNDHAAEALAIYEERYPTLTGDDQPVITVKNYRAAIDLAYVLQRTGQSEPAETLLTAASAFIEDRPRLGWWSGYWIADVRILALQGRKDEALAALQRADEEGWRTLWWYYLRLDPVLESVRDEPEFLSVLAGIEDDMNAQMQRIRDLELQGQIKTVPGVTFPEP